MRRATSALILEKDEAPVISNEYIESTIASFRADLKEVKADLRTAIARLDNDVRTFAAKAESDLKTWGARVESQISELREDVRDLRGDNKSLRDRIDANQSTTDTKLETLRDKVDANQSATDTKLESLRDKVDANQSATEARFDALRDKIDANQAANDARFETLIEKVANLDGLQKAILWVLGLLLVAAGSLVGMVAKALSWI